jgi:hypothetical protein
MTATKGMITAKHTKYALSKAEGSTKFRIVFFDFFVSFVISVVKRTYS